MSSDEKKRDNARTAISDAVAQADVVVEAIDKALDARGVTDPARRASLAQFILDTTARESKFNPVHVRRVPGTGFLVGTRLSVPPRNQIVSPQAKARIREMHAQSQRWRGGDVWTGDPRAKRRTTRPYEGGEGHEFLHMRLFTARCSTCRAEFSGRADTKSSVRERAELVGWEFAPVTGATCPECVAARDPFVERVGVAVRCHKCRGVADEFWASTAEAVAGVEQHGWQPGRDGALLCPDCAAQEPQNREENS